MSTVLKRAWLGILTMAWVCPAVAPGAEPLLMPGKKTLYQRVLSWPDARLAGRPGEAGDKPLPPLSRLYVYERKTVGAEEWLSVGGTSRGKTDGWLPAARGIAWKQQLSLAFTNPANRQRALLFERKEGVLEVLQASDPGASAAALAAAIESGKGDPKVISIEPKEHIDINKQFYLLPILEAQEIATKGGSAMVLEVASVTARGTGPGAPAPASASDPQASATALRTFTAAVVFVIDATISMGPYIDRTKEAVRSIYSTIEKSGIGNQVKFGLVAFRSSTKAVPALEYVAKLYANPSEVRSGQDFLAKVADLKPAAASSARFDEDAYAGVMMALRDIPWGEFGGRYVVLITDAGAIEGADALSETGLGGKQVRIEAQQLGVALYTLHLKTPAGKQNHASAERQYQALSDNAVSGTPLYYAVDSGSVEGFGSMVDTLAKAIVQQVEGASQGQLVAGSARSATAGANVPKAEDPAARIESDARLIGRAMQLAYLGRAKGAAAPDLFQAWLVDKDYADPTIKATEVRVLLTKNELSNLRDAVQAILDAGEQSQESTGSADFFDLLRSSAAHLARDPSRLADPKAKKLAELGLIGEYLDDLPYKSTVLALSSDQWEEWGIDQQEKFLDSLRRDLRHYQIYHDDSDRWIALDGSNDAGEAVYPVPLDALP